MNHGTGTAGDADVTVRLTALPPLTELHRLRDDLGVTRIRVPAPVRLAPDAGVVFCEFVDFLRRAASALIAVDWGGVVDLPPAVAAACAHLSPPMTADSEAARTWQALHPGSYLHLREGPGFRLVKDTRQGRPPSRTVLDEAPELALVVLLSSPRTVEEITDEGLADQLASFLEHDFAAVCDGSAVLLTTRLRRWPIPYSAL
ncbi:DUF5825 family protein [Streptomyces sp. NBC_00503]|uniref:DUF5825 family protein n=1 Tax=Streptomyces sp. NBC_00503 TaxID=2903659 RepID=UPI002E81B8F5|nr:DUF5825 family protein [Streptomyces sp. NBC_00503]WUD79149.1 DUF5825 family protein [Streptomyces sp. NBC_00503]